MKRTPFDSHSPPIRRPLQRGSFDTPATMTASPEYEPFLRMSRFFGLSPSSSLSAGSTSRPRFWPRAATPADLLDIVRLFLRLPDICRSSRSASSTKESSPSMVESASVLSRFLPLRDGSNSGVIGDPSSSSTISTSGCTAAFCDETLRALLSLPTPRAPSAFSSSSELADRFAPRFGLSSTSSSTSISSPDCCSPSL